jgi:hypothetical protein
MPSTLMGLSYYNLKNIKRILRALFFCSKTELVLSTKASINRMGLSAEMLDSKDVMVIWLREIPVTSCMFKNTEFPVFMQMFLYI